MTLLDIFLRSKKDHGYNMGNAPYLYVEWQSLIFSHNFPHSPDGGNP